MSDLSKFPHLEQYIQNLKSIPRGKVEGNIASGDYWGFIMDAFRMGATPVTWGLWKEYVNESGLRSRDSENRVPLEDPGWGFPDNHPVVNVSWNDIMNPGCFADWVSTLAGFRLTLPTDAQWVYAKHGGTDSFFPWGRAFDLSKTWGSNKSNIVTTPQYLLDYPWKYLTKDLFGPSKTAAVDRTNRIFTNGYGLVDMCGNVSEWCYDLDDSYRTVSWEYGTDYSNHHYIITGLDEGCTRTVFVKEFRSVRSMSWDDDVSFDGGTLMSRPPDLRSSRLGFRLAAGPM